MGKKEQKREVLIVGQQKPTIPIELPDPIVPKMEYEAWWLITQRRLNLSPSLKEALKRHFKARGFLESGRYDDGLKDFGINAS